MRSLFYQMSAGLTFPFAKYESATNRTGTVTLTWEEIHAHGKRLDHMQPGQWFATICARHDMLGVEIVTGRLVYPGVGSSLVELDRKEDNRVRWAPETVVLPIPTPDAAQWIKLTLYEEQDKIQKLEREPMTSQNQETAIRKRHSFWTDKLAQATDEAHVEAATDAITKIEAEATKLGIDLTQPQVTSAPATTAAAAKPAKVAKSVAGKDAIADKKSQLASEAGTKTPGATRVKKDKVLQTCLDGCGAQVAGNFQMGHDAKLKSTILKIERGELEVAAIPDVAQDLIKFKKGELEVVKDAKGNTKGKIQHMLCTAAPVRFKGRPEMAFTERAA